MHNARFAATIHRAGFQGLEKLDGKVPGLGKGAAIFPGIGKISGGISKDWKP
jgi:hypothetical protein